MFTCDINTVGLPIDPIDPQKNKREQKLERAKGRQARDRYK